MSRSANFCWRLPNLETVRVVFTFIHRLFTQPSLYLSEQYPSIHLWIYPYFPCIIRTVLVSLGIILLYICTVFVFTCIVHQYIHAVLLPFIMSLYQYVLFLYPSVPSLYPPALSVSMYSPVVSLYQYSPCIIYPVLVDTIIFWRQSVPSLHPSE